MQCDDVRLELQAYVEGEMTSDGRAATEAHLSTCPACAEEARAMKGMGDIIRRGLNEWVEQGSIPADLAARIEVHVRPRKRGWWQSWQLTAGVATAAVAVFLVLFATQPERMASIPLLGVIATQFITPDFTYTVAPGPITEKLPKPSNPVHPAGATAEKLGITLTVNLIEQVGDLTHVQYTVTGITLDKQLLKDPVAHPTLVGTGGRAALRSFNADRKPGEVVFNGYFDPLQAGQRLTLAIAGLPVGDEMVQGPWQVTFSN